MSEWFEKVLSDEKLERLELEEEQASYHRVKLYYLGKNDSYSYIYPSLGRIVYTTYDYDYIIGDCYTKHRISIEDYLRLMKENIKNVEVLLQH